MIDGWPPAPGSASLALALALVFASCAPMWALVAWVAASRAISRSVAERTWLRWFVWVGFIAALVGSTYVSTWVYHTLLGPFRRPEQKIVYGVYGGQLLLLLFAFIWISQRRAGTKTAPDRTAPSRRGKPGPIVVGLILLLWSALAVAFFLLRFGPHATEPPSSRDVGALVVAGAIMTTLIAILIRAVRETRTGAKDGGSTGSP